jgi:hypothetical protein
VALPLVEPSPAHGIWSGYAPSNFHFCEARLDAWVSEPANAWSCVAYVLVGAFVLLQARRERALDLRPAGYAAIAIGVFSFVYHATALFVTEFLDLFSMYLFSTYVFAATLHRLLGWTPRRCVGVYVGTVLAQLALLVAIRPIGIVLFGAQILAVLAMEWRLARTRVGVDRPVYVWLWRLLATFVVALVVWVLDLTRLACDPDQHVLQGHAAWHVINSLCIYMLYRFYRQFDFGGGARRAFVASGGA